MKYIWRPTLKKYIEARYIHHPNEWYNLVISTPGLLNITIVSDRFTQIHQSQRREQLLDLLREAKAPTSLGFISLFTTSEANSLGLFRESTVQNTRANNWLDLAEEVTNDSENPKVEPGTPRTPHTVTFYSFKGGVGCTTALTHVAWILAMRGRRVVAVDLDLEAPGLSFLLKLTPRPEHGLVDYFYEHSYLPREVEPTISISEIFGEVRIPDASGRLFVVSAGLLNLNYMAKVDDLRASATAEHGEDLWSLFFREITEQLHPDIILIDSRTGIDEWSAFSLLRAADQAIIFLYPNDQNKQGADLLLEALADRIPLQLVFSPVPFGDAGIERVREYWQDLQSRLDVITDQANVKVDEGIPEVETQSDMSEPITVNYLTELALALSYPVLPLLSNYMNIANVIDKNIAATI